MSTRLVLIRGLPGSGKSTLAKQYAARGYVHCEADMYFVYDDGVYRFNPAELRSAHEWCQRETQRALEGGGSVVVSNTFSQRWELAPYLAMVDPPDVLIIECHGTWPSVHNVPAAAIERMCARWEAIDGETSADDVAAEAVA